MTGLTAERELRMKVCTAVVLAILWGWSLLWTYRFAADNVNNARDAATASVLVASIEQHDRKADAGQRAETKAVARIVRTESTFQRLDQEVLRYAQTHAGITDCGLDADGLRTWTAANANALPEADGAGQLDDGLPGPAGTGQRQDHGPAVEPRASGEAVPQMPGALARPGGMDEGDPMTDFADDAIESEQEARQRALQAQQQRAGLQGKTMDDSATYCEECDVVIPDERRQAVPGVQTCFACQSELERAMHIHTRGYA